jgi:hypothetical protein
MEGPYDMDYTDYAHRGDDCRIIGKMVAIVSIIGYF